MLSTILVFSMTVLILVAKNKNVSNYSKPSISHFLSPNLQNTQRFSAEKCCTWKQIGRKNMEAKNIFTDGNFQSVILSTIDGINQI